MIVDKTGEVQRYSEKYLLQSSKDNMLRNSISVDMKVYDVQLKQNPQKSSNFWRKDPCILKFGTRARKEML